MVRSKKLNIFIVLGLIVTLLTMTITPINLVSAETGGEYEFKENGEAVDMQTPAEREDAVSEDVYEPKDNSDEAGTLTLINQVSVERDGDYEYADNGNGTAKITNYLGEATDVEIPDRLGGLIVTEIGDKAFQLKGLTSVVIPESVTSIGDYAFADNQANSADLTIVGYDPSAAKDYALANGHTFENIIERDYEWTINGDGTATITQYKGISKDVVIPQELGGHAVTRINHNVFYNRGLTSVTIPDGITSMGANAFRDNQLTSLTIPASVTSIGNVSFDNNQLEKLVLENGVISIGESAFSNNAITELIIPESVTSIGANAFFSNQLSSISIPNSVSSIGAYSFSYNKLATVIIRNESVSIGAHAFANNKVYSSELVIFGDDPSTAKTYAEEYNHTFKDINPSAEEDYQWSKHSDGTAEIISYRGSDKDVIIPEELGGYRVTRIGSLAFYGRGLTSVTIPDGVTTIESSAFSTNQLTSITLPDSVTTIEKSAFFGNQLTSIDFPNGIEVIEDSVFLSNKLTHVEIPNSVVSIERAAFASNQLSSVDIPNSVTSIGEQAFARNQLTSVTIPNSITQIESSTFTENQLESVVIPDSVISIESRAFQSNKLMNISIPASVTSIGDSAFAENQLTSVTIPGSLTNMGGFIFHRNELTSVTISDGVTAIGTSMFTGNKLTSVTIPESVTSIGGGAFSANQLERVIIHNKDTNIGDYAFDNQTTPFSEITLVGHIGSTTEAYAKRKFHKFIPEFDYDWLDHGDGTATITGYKGTTKDIVIPSTLGGLEVVSIGSNAFKDAQLTSVTIPNSVTSIEVEAFRGNRLTRVSIPDSVRRIGDTAFFGNQLTTTTILNDAVTFGEKVFDGNQPNPRDVIVVGHRGSTAETYANAQGHTFIAEFEYRWIDNGDGTATIIGYLGTATDLLIPHELDGLTVTEIMYSSFLGKSLTKVVIPESVTSIGNHAFSNNHLTHVSIPDGVISIGVSAFSENKLTSISIADTVTSIGNSAFAGNKLTDVSIPNSVTVIGKNAFAGNKLTAVTLPNNVTKISEGAFSYNNLTNVVIPYKVTELENRVFYGWNKLASVTILNKGIVIPGDAFLGTYVLPQDVTIVGYLGSTAEVHAKSKGFTFKKFAPEIQVTDITDTTISLSWDELPLISEYVLKRDGNEVYHGSGIVFEDTGLNSDTEYEYSIIGTGSGGNSETTIVKIKTAPPVPNQPNLRVGNTSETTVTLSWDVVPHATEYILKRNDVEIYRGTNTAYDDTGLTPDTSYTYELVATNKSGISDASTIPARTALPIPAQPTLTIDKIGETTITLSWASVQYAEEYILERDDVEVYRGSDTTYEDTELMPDTPYTYALVATNKSGTSGAATIPARTVLPIPATPNIAIEDTGETAVTLSWASVPYAAEYILKRDGLEIFRGLATTYEDLGLIPDKSYTYALVATNTSGTSTEATTTVRTVLPIPAQPTLFIDNAGETTIKLTWASVQYAAEYILERDGAEVYRGTDTAYEDTGLVAGTSYTYALVATNRSGTSNVATITAKTVLPIPATPNLVISDTGETRVILSWDRVQYAVEYILERNGVEVYRGSATTYEDTGLAPDTSYTYTLVATNRSGTSDSATITAKTTLPIPAKPTLVIEDTGESTVTLSWDSVQYASGYILKRDIVEVYQGTSITFVDEGLDTNTDYTYKLVATNDSGRSVEANITARTSKSSNANLSRLTISEGTLNPSFHYDNLEYSANVANRIDSIIVTPTVEDNNATVIVNGYAVINGSASNSIMLDVGKNTITIEVIAEDGKKKTYRLTVTRSTTNNGGGGGGGGSTPTPAPKEPSKDEEIEKEEVEQLDEANELEKVDDSEKEAPQLSDIAGHWAEINIQALVNLGAITGYPDGTFLPNNHITRAEFVTVLVKAFGLEASGGKVFVDTANHWAKDAIATAEAHGIISGYTETIFGVNDYITREQMAVMIVRAILLQANNESVNFTDSANISTWAVEAILAAIQAEIITGYPDHTFKPQGHATRAEAVTVIMRALGQ